MKKELYLNSYYKLNLQKYNELKIGLNIGFRRAENNVGDLKKIKEYLILFFEADTESAIERITNERKLADEIENGVYLLERDKQTIGMARFFGQSNAFNTDIKRQSYCKEAV